MRNALTIARRVLSQFSHDKRTLALLFVAPVVVLWLLSVLLGADAYEPRLATVDLPASFQSALEEQDARITDASEAEAERLLRANEADAVLRMRDDATLEIWAAIPQRPPLRRMRWRRRSPRRSRTRPTK